MTPISKFEDATEFIRFEQRLEQVKDIDIPYFLCHNSPLCDVSLMENNTVLNFGSNNYLGMSGRREVSEASKRAIDVYGTSSSGSRVLVAEKKLYLELEKEIAEWKQADAAVVFPAGNLTNTTFVGNFCNEKDAIFYDVLSHSSIEQGCRMSKAFIKRFPHNNYRELEKLLIKHRNKFEKVLIVIEGAYSMDGDIAPVPEFVRLKKEYNGFLMVDEAHSDGVIGENGGGVSEYFKLQPDDIDIKMGTLSKAIGSLGGYIAGSSSLVNYLKYNLPGFVFSSAMSPSNAAAALEAIKCIRRDSSVVKQLQKNIKLFIAEAQRRGYHTCLAKETSIVPILIGKDRDAYAASKAMISRGVFVPPVVYPAVSRNQSRLRFNVISEHKPEQIMQALDTLDNVLEELKINGKREHVSSV